jgi:CBS domain-containing protein
MMDVRDVMTTSVVSVNPSTALKEVAQLLVEHGISGVPVVDDTGAVLGLVTGADFLVKGQSGAAAPRRRFVWLLGDPAQSPAEVAKLAATNAGEAMTSPAITIGPGQTISEAARTMTERRVNRLPVIKDGRLVGIVSRADVVRVYARSDAELAETVRQDVLLRSLWLDPAAFTVDVHDGRVSISGPVDRRSMAEMIEKFVRMMPGVVDVDADITWSLDDSEIKPPSTDPVFPYSPR